VPLPINPMRIPGAWKEGYVLDYHTKSSEFIGDDEYGRPQFNTVRTPAGELLYQVKYRRGKAALTDLISVAAEFIRGWGPPVKAIVPVPPSRPRPSQPVLQIAEGIGRILGIPVRDVVRKAPNAKELKDVFGYHERLQLLARAHRVASADLHGKSVLVVDDLYRSGATLNAVAASLRAQGKVREVYVFCPTRTRSSA
jgi:competence protein ComFC